MGEPDGTIREITTRRSEVCRAILADLPAWFGIPQAVDDYVRASSAAPRCATGR